MADGFVWSVGYDDAGINIITESVICDHETEISRHLHKWLKEHVPSLIFGEDFRSIYFGLASERENLLERAKQFAQEVPRAEGHQFLSVYVFSIAAYHPTIVFEERLWHYVPSDYDVYRDLSARLLQLDLSRLIGIVIFNKRILDTE